MKYQLKSEINDKGLLDAIYANRNLDQQMVYRLLNANKSDLKDPSMIFNMNRAVEMFKKIYKEDLVIGLLIDPDVR